MKVVAILQARMSSTRLPGKVLFKINNKSIIEHVVENAIKSNLIDDYVVATSNDQSDDLIEEICLEKSLNIYRGSLEDVLDRYYKAAIKYSADIVVRLTCDCPLVSPITIDSVVSSLINGQFDYSANTCPPKTSVYPDGSDVEVFTFQALEKAYNSNSKYVSREHVTFQFWQDKNYSSFQLRDLNKRYNNLRYTLDYEEDFEVINIIFNELLKKNISKHSVENILEIYKDNPELENINNKYYFGIGWKK